MALRPEDELPMTWTPAADSRFAGCFPVSFPCLFAVLKACFTAALLVRHMGPELLLHEDSLEDS